MIAKKVQTLYERISDVITVTCKALYGMSHFETIVLFIAFSLSLSAYGQNQCSELFNYHTEQVQSTTINPNANTNAYKANSSAARKLWDKATMGVLGEMYDLVENPQSKSSRNTPKVNEALKTEIEVRTKKILEEEIASVTPRHLEIINRTTKISDLTGDTKLVSVKNYTVGKETPELEQAIKNYFSLSYIKLVNWVYRLHNLEKNDPISSAIMMDEVAAYAMQGYGFEFNLIYDNKILEKHLQIIAKVINEYEATTDFLKRKNALKKLEVEIPLMPIAGVTVAVKITDSKSPV